MVQHSETIDTPGLDTASALPLVYGSFLKLGWTVQFIDAERVIGFTRKVWGQPVDQVTIRAADGRLEVTCALPTAHIDPRKTNAKKVAQFAGAWPGVSSTATDAQRADWAAVVADIRQRIAVALEEEKKEAEALKAVMPAGEQGAVACILLALVNIGVFVGMWLTGVGFFEPSIEGLLRWGANASTYTLDGEPWRLVTSMFVHIGVVHLLMNLYALFIVGAQLEPILGIRRFAAVYFATGIIASLTSLWWHNDSTVSAGASGAIFGLFGFFLALLTTDLIPRRTRKSLLQQILIYIGVSLLYGLKQGIDNSAHVGGLVSGLLFGYGFGPFLKPGRRRSPAPSLLALLLSVGIAGYYVTTHRYDTHSFEFVRKQLSAHSEKALTLPDSLSGAAYAERLASVALPEWKAAEQEMATAAGYRLPAYLLPHRELLTRYVRQRVRETELLIRLNRGDSSAGAPLAQLNTELGATLEALYGKEQ
ncbi:MAG: rhomboid family intramembrane serine protease [Chitinophagaceae bacterium]|nr:MAG: rhomboid family intramembrane serine protease [Chitinophagaceae bacterium]